jgi:hypothetical protein
MDFAFPRGKATERRDYHAIHLALRFYELAELYTYFPIHIYGMYRYDVTFDFHTSFTDYIGVTMNRKGFGNFRPSSTILSGNVWKSMLNLSQVI